MCLQITAVAFSPDGQTLASGSEDGALMTWDLRDARRTALTPEHTGPVWSLAYSHGAGSLLASGMQASQCNIREDVVRPSHVTLSVHAYHVLPNLVEYVQRFSNSAK